MNMKKTTILLLILGNFFWIGGNAAFAEETIWKRYHIEVSDLTEEQLNLLEQSILDLKALPPGELQINQNVYHRLSRFKSLFGFSFNGEKLTHWLLKRIRKIKARNSWTAAVNQNKGNFLLGDAFFKRLTPLERLYLLIHEARHSDDHGHNHVNCPEGFIFISAGQPEMDLENQRACDEGPHGAYAFQAAFLFELYAYGLFDQNMVGLLYNSSLTRILSGD